MTQTTTAAPIRYWVSLYQITNTEGAMRPETDRYVNQVFATAEERETLITRCQQGRGCYDISRRDLPASRFDPLGYVPPTDQPREEMPAVTTQPEPIPATPAPKVPEVLALYMESSQVQTKLASVPTYIEVSSMISRILPALRATGDFASHAHAFDSTSGDPATDATFTVLAESARATYRDLSDLQSALLKAATILEKFVGPDMMADASSGLLDIYRAEAEAEYRAKVDAARDAEFEASRQEEWTASNAADLLRGQG